MRAPSLFLILLAASLAGCTDASDEDPLEAEGGMTSTVEATRNGTVVVDVLDAEAEPVAGAAVTLANHTQTTDPEGRATFEGVAVGQHRITVEKDGFRQARSAIEVVAGDTVSTVVRLATGAITPPPVDAPDPAADAIEAYTETFHLRGRFECSATYLIITGDCMVIADFALENATGSCGPPCPGDVTAEANVLEFPLDVDWKSVVVEMAWEADATAGEEMTLNLEPSDASEDGHAARYARVHGGSPLGFTLHAGMPHETATASADGEEPDLPNPLGGEVVQARAFVAGALHNAGDAGFLGVGAAINQQFDVFATVFYVEPAPEGWSIADQ